MVDNNRVAEVYVIEMDVADVVVQRKRSNGRDARFLFRDASSHACNVCVGRFFSAVVVAAAPFFPLFPSIDSISVEPCKALKRINLSMNKTTKFTDYKKNCTLIEWRLGYHCSLLLLLFVL